MKKLLLVCLAVLAANVAFSGTGMNVILIMADDSAADNYGCYGSTFFKTPVLDGLAANGAKFNHCYSEPVCTPSRVKIMTGRDGIRNYAQFGTLDKDEITFGTMMKNAGYATAIAGKWQLHGGSNGSLAPDCGFDTFCLWNYPGGGRERFWNPGIIRDGTRLETTKDDYGPDIFTDYIIDFIEKNKERPFFVYYPMVLVHAPFLPTPDSQPLDAMGKKDQALEYFRDMTAYADKCVGRIVDALEQNGLRENTVVIIYFDDTGWKNFGCFGGMVDTPNIDQLAKDGMRFTEYYAPAPNCSPSRTGLLTGRFPFRVGMYSYRGKSTPMHLPDSEVTIAEILKTKGFATGMFGKWHLCDLEKSTQPTPDKQGFDYWFACDNNLVKRNPHSLYRNGKPVGETEGWAAQVVADEANGWMKKQTSPFFAYIAFSETHVPYDAPDELKAKYAAKGEDKKRAVYKGMTEYSDAAVGSILKTLDDMGVGDNTFVFLASDNGPTADESCEGLRGKKSYTWEGGVRVPAIIRWPGTVKPGSEYNDPVGGIDLLPTLCDIVGAELPEKHIDGVNIRPILEGKTFNRTAPILTFFYRTSPAASMRLGDYVLIAHSDDEARTKSHGIGAEDMPMIKSTKLVSFELYNVKDDLGQEKDIAASHPEKLAELRKTMVALHREAINEGPVWEFPEAKTKAKSKKREEK